MNRQFVMKMMQAKKLEYEAMKEIMPEQMVNRITSLEKELMDFGKEYFMTVVCGDQKESTSPEQQTKSRTKKVTIE